MLNFPIDKPPNVQGEELKDLTTWAKSITGWLFKFLLRLTAYQITLSTDTTDNSTFSYAFASLPTNPVVGQLANITDSNTAVWGAIIAAGGANKVLGWWNGTNWTVVGK